MNKCLSKTFAVVSLTSKDREDLSIPKEMKWKVILFVEGKEYGLVGFLDCSKEQIENTMNNFINEFNQQFLFFRDLILMELGVSKVQTEHSEDNLENSDCFIKSYEELVN